MAVSSPLICDASERSDQPASAGRTKSGKVPLKGGAGGSETQGAIVKQWSVEKAQTWWDGQEWPVGCCFVPSYAINQFEMWQPETFNLPVLDKEFGLCEELGFNLVRIYLHEELWFADAEGFKDRIRQVLDLTQKHGIKVTFTFCTNGGSDSEKLGPQPGPKPGVHGGGHWCQSPGKDIFFNEDRWPEFKAYLQDILRSFGKDSRILYWCLYNEPENVRMGRDCLKFMKEMYEWAWEVRPDQPLTSPVWQRPGYAGTKTRLDMVSFVCQNSDIISFHCYYPAKELETFINMLHHFHRPMICQEYMGRTLGSTFETCLPVMKREKVGALNWGLVEGKCKYRFPWGHKEADGEPDLWFHSIFWEDYTPYNPVEIEVIKKITANKAEAGKNPRYPIK